ncbi:unnamed protein product [Didymodactylos carnosus]|uniref:NAD(P)(+)--arginine ADP-ribosyltransferase n=1 Tax=Didymodactylos carnosus TaxID=1234261 RepID=A0A814NWL1_9BILA|nr:unnamed protein product [Didymodactylos carnosus]CAF1099467.1 unnamed protein product [Didymodactylos carnosus]CAF3757009.1 unnamed protein product [Didymodactylos carnosus]CAF3864523.1 unnamed protein product [Didymodactylos carnosus]
MSSYQRFTDIEISNKRLPACFGYLSSKLVPLETAVEPIRDLVLDLVRFAKLAKKYCTYPNEHGLTQDESAALYLYTMEMSDEQSFYHILNQTLRDENRSALKPWFPYLKLLDTAVNKLPSTKTVVWRGVGRNVSDSFQKNQTVTWWSVSSCSESVNIVKQFLSNSSQSTLFNIECIDGKKISLYTCYPEENEILLMPGTTLKVVSDPLHHHGGLHIVHLKEIGNDNDNSTTATASAITDKMSGMKISSNSK